MYASTPVGRMYYSRSSPKLSGFDLNSIVKRHVQKYPAFVVANGTDREYVSSIYFYEAPHGNRI